MKAASTLCVSDRNLCVYYGCSARQSRDLPCYRRVAPPNLPGYTLGDFACFVQHDHLAGTRTGGSDHSGKGLEATGSLSWFQVHTVRFITAVWDRRD